MVQDRPPPSPDEPDGEPGTAFEARLAKAREASQDKTRKGPNESSAFGAATRLVAELVSGLVVGGGIGWLLDRWLGTGPWLLVAFFMLGAAAGLLNVMRAARDMTAAAVRRQESEAGQKHDAGPKSGGEDDKE